MDKIEGIAPENKHCAEHLTGAVAGVAPIEGNELRLLNALTAVLHAVEGLSKSEARQVVNAAVELVP